MLVLVVQRTTSKIILRMPEYVLWESWTWVLCDKHKYWPDELRMSTRMEWTGLFFRYTSYPSLFALVSCPNPCSSHGYCASLHGRETCICDDGFALDDCSAEIGTNEGKEYLQFVSLRVWPRSNSQAHKLMILFSFHNNTTGELPELPSVYSYGKKHKKDKLFNDSTVAVVRISMSDSEFQWLLNPNNLYSEKYIKADMWFNNQRHAEHVSEVGIRVKGSKTRYTSFRISLL